MRKTAWVVLDKNTTTNPPTTTSPSLFPTDATPKHPLAEPSPQTDQVGVNIVTLSSYDDSTTNPTMYLIGVAVAGVLFLFLVLIFHIPCSGDTRRENKDRNTKGKAGSSVEENADDDTMDLLLSGNELTSEGINRRSSGNDEKVRNIEKNSYRIWKARFMAIFAAVLTGTNFVVIKILNESMPVGIHSMLRFGIGALFSSPFLFLNRMETGNLDCFALGIESGLWDGVAYLAQALGLRTVPVAVSSFICAADIALILVLDRITGVPVVCRQWIGAILAMVGVTVLTTVESSGESSGNSVKTTDLLLTLLQPIGFGVAFWRLGHAMDRFPGQAARLTAAQTLAIFVLSIALALWEIDRSSLGSYPWSDWFSDPKLIFCILYAGLGTDLLANYLVNLSRDTLSSLECFLIYSTEQIWAALFAWVLLGESVGWGTTAGAVLIILGCVLGSEELKLF